MSKRNKRQQDKLKNLQAKKRRIIKNIDSLLTDNKYQWEKLIPINQSKRNRLLSLVNPRNLKYVKLAEDQQKLSTIYNIYSSAVRDLNGQIEKLQDQLKVKRRAEHEYTGEGEDGMVIVTAYYAWDRKEFENKLFKDYNFKTINNLSTKTQVNDIYQSLTEIYDDMNSNRTLVLIIKGRDATVEYVKADQVKDKDKDEEI